MYLHLSKESNTVAMTYETDESKSFNNDNKMFVFYIKRNKILILFYLQQVYVDSIFIYLFRKCILGFFLNLLPVLLYF